MCSVGSLTVGTFGGLFQKKIKRLLAYSAIAHVGYILLGFIVGSVEGVQAVFIYLFFYLSSSLGIFALLLSLRFIFCSTLKGGAWPKTNTHNKIYFFTPIFITDLLFLLRGNKLLSLSFLTFIFSMAGIPPLAGFYGKLYLFFSCLSAELYSLVVFSVVMSVISCFYYLRLIKFVYFSSLASSKFVDRIYSFKINTYSSFIIAFIFLFISGFVFYPGPVLYVAHFLAIELIS
jgi:NADH-quinone oxidoreductase subunit N